MYDVCFASGTYDRTPQNLMTTVPEKVWPGAEVPYIFDEGVGEFIL